MKSVAQIDEEPSLTISLRRACTEKPAQDVEIKEKCQRRAWYHEDLVNFYPD
jgi:hypothetical protein